MIVKLGQYKNLGFKRPTVFVSDAEYQSALSNLRNALAKWEESTKPAKLGNKITINYFATFNGEKLSEINGENVELILGDGGFNPDFENSIVNLNKNKIHSFEVTLPGDFSIKRLQGKTVMYEVTLKKVEEFKHPNTINDILNLLSDCELKTQNQLEMKIKKELYVHKYKIALEKTIKQILNNVVKSTAFKFDRDDLKRKVTKKFNSFMNHLQEENISIEVYYAYNHTTPKKFKKHFIKNAEEEIILNAVVEEIAKTEQIEISDEEIMPYKYKYLYENKLKEEEFDGVKYRIKNEVKRQKTIKYLINVNTG